MDTYVCILYRHIIYIYQRARKWEWSWVSVQESRCSDGWQWRAQKQKQYQQHQPHWKKPLRIPCAVQVPGTWMRRKGVKSSYLSSHTTCQTETVAPYTKTTFSQRVSSFELLCSCKGKTSQTNHLFLSCTIMKKSTYIIGTACSDWISINSTSTITLPSPYVEKCQDPKEGILFQRKKGWLSSSCSRLCPIGFNLVIATFNDRPFLSMFPVMAEQIWELNSSLFKRKWRKRLHI